MDKGKILFDTLRKKALEQGVKPSSDGEKLLVFFKNANYASLEMAERRMLEETYNELEASFKHNNDGKKN